MVSAEIAEQGCTSRHETRCDLNYYFMSELTNTVAPELTLEARFENRQRLSRIAAETKAQLDAENEAIKADMIAAGLETYRVGDEVLVLSVRDGKRTLDKAELVALGVGTDVIEKATKVGKDYVQLDVRKAK